MDKLDKLDKHYNILFNNNLNCDSWNKRISCEQCEPISSPSDTKKEVVTLKPFSNKVFIFSYEDNAPLVANKEYMFSLYVKVDVEDDSYSYVAIPCQPNPNFTEDYYLNQNLEIEEDIDNSTIITSSTSMSTLSVSNYLKKKNGKKMPALSLFKGRYFNEKNIITDFKTVNEKGTWVNLKWNFKISKEKLNDNNSQRISFYIKHASDFIISLWKPELFCLSGIYDLDTYKNFDFFKMSINLFNDYKNTCVNIYTGTKTNLTGFFISTKYICSVYNEELSKQKIIYAQVFPDAIIVPIVLIGMDKVLNIAVYYMMENKKNNINNFFMLDNSITITKTMLICTLNRQYSTSKHQITPGFVVSNLNNSIINDALFQTTFESSNSFVGQPVLNPSGELIGMITTFFSYAFCLHVSGIQKITSRIIKAYEKNRENIPLQMTGSFLGIKFHYCNNMEKSNAKIEGRDAIVIDNIYADSPAYKSGLKEGDIIFNFSKNNTPVNMNLSFFDYLYTKKPDATIYLEYSKNYSTDHKLPIEIKLESRRNYDDKLILDYV